MHLVDWLRHPGWREVLVIGYRPPSLPAAARFLRLQDVQGLLGNIRPGERIFGCGNIAGLPLKLSEKELLA